MHVDNIGSDSVPAGIVQSVYDKAMRDSLQECTIVRAARHLREYGHSADIL